MSATWLAEPPSALVLQARPVPVVGRVRIYVCGITPYDVTHLGHAATYVWADTLDRVLRRLGHSTVVARNVTDVDDVLFAEARRRAEPVTMLATLQRAQFEATMAALRVRTPDHSPSATQHVANVIQLANALLARGAGYERGGTVYARTPGVGATLAADLANRLAREYRDDPDDANKEHPFDTVVWRGTDDGEVSWPSPWGAGRPGWHAECAAMVLALFGPSVDVHCGGADLAFPHHACEAALAEAATGVAPFARAWLRAGTVGIDGAKMAKSSGNLVLVDDLLRAHRAAAIRLLCLHRPWSQAWEFTAAALDTAEQTLDELYAAAGRPGAEEPEVLAALRADLDVPGALAAALERGGAAARELIEILALG